MFKAFHSNYLQRFSIRKASVGAVSVLLGTLIFLGGSQVSADDLSSSTSPSVEYTTGESSYVDVDLASDNLYLDVEMTSLSTEGTSSNEEPVDNQLLTSKMLNNPDLPLESYDKNTILSSENATLNSETTDVYDNSDNVHDSSDSLSLSALSLENPFRSAQHTSSALGDNYPQVWKNGVIWQSVDKWNMYVKECVSFAAFRLSSANGFELPFGYGNANTWGHIARRSGYRVDMTPAVGAIAWTDSYQYGAYAAGHVAWVSGVFGEKVEIEEYNYNNSHAYNRRTIHRSEVTGYIHFKDLVGGVSNPVVSKPAKPTLASSGTYRFDKRLGIKSEPKVSNPDLAYYGVGDTVNYDSVLEADGHQWISYLSYAGNRRYIAVNKLASQSTLTGDVSVTQRSDGFDILVTNVPKNADIKTVKLGVWTTADGQEDLVWYTASKQANGTYKTTVSLAQHDDERGEYQIKLQYVKTNREKVTVSTTKTRTSEPLVEKPQPVTVNLPPRGTYHFKQRVGIKAEPKAASPDLAYYDLGYSVNYDSIVIAEGRQWLSYLSYAGNRRYVALP